MPCSRQPLNTMTALSFLGESTKLIGMLPSSMAAPAGSSRTPVGSGDVERAILQQGLTDLLLFQVHDLKKQQVSQTLLQDGAFHVAAADRRAARPGGRSH